MSPPRDDVRAIALCMSIVALIPGPGPHSRTSDVKRFRGGLVFKAHRRLYHSTLGWRVIKKKKNQKKKSDLCVDFGAKSRGLPRPP